MVEWFHQLPDPGGATIDIAAYVSKGEGDDCPRYPFMVIECGWEGSNKDNQAKAYPVNISHHCGNANQVIFSLELILSRSGEEDSTMKLHAFTFPRDLNTSKLDHTHVWSGVATIPNLAKVLYCAMTHGAIHNIATLHPGGSRPALLKMGPHCYLDQARKKVMKVYDYRVSNKRESQKRSSTLSESSLKATTVLKAPRLLVVEYDFIEGSHVATSVFQFLEIIAEIESLHSGGICHGDIRAANIVFVQGGRSRLIDFDFSGKIGTKVYPEGYSADIPDATRHPNAKGRAVLEKVHDWFSLASVMSLFDCPSEREAWDKARHSLKGGKVKQCCNMLESIRDSKVVIGEKGVLLLDPRNSMGTGSPPLMKKGKSMSRRDLRDEGVK